MATSTTPPTIQKQELKYVKLIGEGGFSSVYQMTWMHPSLGPIEIAAKKLIKHDVAELKMMKDLDHPNIVKLLGVVDEPMDFMLILELCDRGSLRSYLKELHGQPLSDEQFRDWAEQAARPLEYLRERHIVHKDVKSPNYMITADNNLKLGDFGISKNLADTTYNATTSASYPWMAPELLRDGVLSPKYDIFAYGVIVWELRTGKCPFEGLEFQVVAWRVCHENQRLPIPEECPQPIKDLMMRCWQKDWRKRPDIEEVLELIKEATATSTSSASSSSSAIPPSPSSATTPLLASMSATTPPIDSTTKHILDGWWILEREFGPLDGPGQLNYAGGIAVNPSNGDIALSTKAPSSNVHTYTINGEYKFSMDTAHGLQPGQVSYPQQVAVNSQGNTYFVTDKSSYVKCFDSDGQPKGQWVSSCPQASYPPSLYGLAIDHDGHVLAGDIENFYINKHKQEGTYLGSIKVRIEPLFIAAISLGKILVAQRYSPPEIWGPIGQDSDAGHDVPTLKHPVNAQWNTEGVYVHEDNILIADGATNSILQFSTSGDYKYLGTPIPDAPNPRGVAMTADGRKLVVGCSTTDLVKVFKFEQYTK